MTQACEKFNISKTYSTLKLISDLEIHSSTKTGGALEVFGDINCSKTVYANNINANTITYTSLALDDGNAENGFVMTSDDSGIVSLKPKLWSTNDSPELITGPSDSNIYTSYMVGINTTTPGALLDVFSNTVGEGGILGNAKIGVWADANTSCVFQHKNYSNTTVNYALRHDGSDGATFLNSSNEIQFSISDAYVAGFDNSGNFGIGIETPTESLHVGGNAIIEGDLTVLGSMTSIESSVMTISDSTLKLADGNMADTIDIGYYGQYYDNGSLRYSGILRDASETNKPYVLFSNGDTEPSNILSGTYDYGNLELGSIEVHDKITHSGFSIESSGGISTTFDSTGKMGVNVITPLEDVHIYNGLQVETGKITLGMNTQNTTGCSVYFNTTDAMIIPSGTSVERPGDDIVGSLRFNTDINYFEGWSGEDWVNLGSRSVINKSGTTFIDAEYNLEEDMIRFHTDNSPAMIITNTQLVGIGTVSPIVSCQISATDAIGIPSGTTNERPSALAGFCRFNTTRDSLEVYNGTEWYANHIMLNQSNNSNITVNNSEEIIFENNSVESFRITSSGDIGIKTSTPSYSLDINTTDAMRIPCGTSAQRPDAIDSLIRYNTDYNTLEGYSNGSWEILQGLRDSSNATYISPDSSELKFYTNSVSAMTIDNSQRVGINTETPISELDVNGDINAVNGTFSGNVIISGDLTVSGIQTVENYNTITTEDSIINMGYNNAADNFDLGWAGEYTEDATTKYTGVFRDASDGIFKIFKSYEPALTTTIDINDVSFAYGSMEMNAAIVDIVQMRDDEIKFTGPSGTSKMLLNNDGLSIGSLNSGGYKFTVTGSDQDQWTGRFTNGNAYTLIAKGSSNGLVVNSGAESTNTSYCALFRNSDNTNIMSVANNGRVGINKLSPVNLLDIPTTTAGEGIIVGNVFTGNSDVLDATISHKNFVVSSESQALTQSSTGKTIINSGSGQSLDFAINKDVKFTLESDGVLNINSPSNTTGILNVGGTLTVDDNLNVSNNLLFINGATSNIGISTSSPQEKLHISNGNLAIDTIGDNTVKSVQFFKDTYLTSDAHFYIKNNFTDATPSLNIGSFNTTADVDSLSISLNGNVGIKTTSPTVDFEVNGDALISNNLTVNSTTLVVDATNGRIGVGTNTPQYTLDVNGNGYISGNLTIGGGISFTGEITDTLKIEDPLITLASGNTGNIVDIGQYGTYNDGVQKYTGIFRDASDGKTKLFDGLEEEPISNVINTAAVSYTDATLVVGDVEASGNITCQEIISSSDKRLKKDIKKLDDTNGDVLEMLTGLNLYSYTFKQTNKKSRGFIAQEVEEVFPELITKRSGRIDGEELTDIMAISQNQLIIYLVASLKTLNARVKILEKKEN